MDKEEYRQKLDELTGYVGDKDYANALQIVEEIDWRRVKNINTLSMVAEVYEINKNYKKAKEILILALGRASIGKNILYRLVEVCLKLGENEEAEKYFRDYSKVARNDNSRCILQYKLYKAKKAPIEAQINVLEEYREREYTERWAYELTTLYAKAGDTKKCVEACDDLILWFSDGEYVYKAMELKQRYEELTPGQKQAYESMKALYSSGAAAQTAAVQEASSGEEEADGVFAGDETEDGNTAEGILAAAQATTLKESPASLAHKALAGANTKLMDTQDFNLEAFLAETAGGFSNEISGGFGETADENPAEEPVKDAALAEESVGDEVPKDVKSGSAEQTEAGTDESMQTAPAAAAADGKTDVVDQEKTEAGDTLVQDGREAEEPLNNGKKTDVGGTTEAISRSLEEFFEKQSSGEPEVTEEKQMQDAEKLKSAVAALEGLSAGTVEADEEAGEEEVSGEAEAAEAKDAQEEMVVRDLEQEDLATVDSGDADGAEPASEGPHYIEELEVPDPEPTGQEKKSRTIPLNTIGQNTVPISIDKILSEETPEERRIRILNNAKPTRMNEEQRKIFTYFARIPGMDNQILDAINSVYEHAGERTSLHGNIAVMGAEGTGKSRLSRGLIMTMCKDLGLEAAKIAHITGEELNQKDPARVVSVMAGGFLMVEKVSGMNEETLEKLNQAMEFRTDCMIMIIEDDKTQMRSFLKKHPQFAEKFDRVISVPVFTNDELITFARTYAVENGCKIDDLAILALYTMIGNIQTEEEPVTISTVKRMVDGAIHRATRGRRRKKNASKDKWITLHEKDFG